MSCLGESTTRSNSRRSQIEGTSTLCNEGRPWGLGGGVGSRNNRHQRRPSECASSLFPSPHLQRSFFFSLCLFCLHGRIYLMLLGHRMSRYWFLFPPLRWWVFDAGVQGHAGLFAVALSSSSMSLPSSGIFIFHTSKKKNSLSLCVCRPPDTFCFSRVIVWSPKALHDSAQEQQDVPKPLQSL